MSITVILNNKKNFHLFYSAEKFATGKTVTGYFIYPNLEKSDDFLFDDLGDGIYSAEIINNRTGISSREKYGIVVKEDGEVKKFEMIQIYY